MPIAVVTLRPEPYYRRQAVLDGLLRLGYATTESSDFRAVAPLDPHSRDDLLVLWNLKQGSQESLAARWEQRGGSVIVMENAYLQKEDKSRYALSVHGHCGAGWFPFDPTEDRFSALGFPLESRGCASGHILVCGQRGIGSSEMASPPGWAERETTNLQGRHRHREVRLRKHPGNHAAKTPLERDLEGASKCVIWSSSAGVRALTLGIPVVYQAPHWICSEAAQRFALCPPPGEALNRMAHGQWSVEEIASGEPFARMRAQGWGAASWC